MWDKADVNKNGTLEGKEATAYLDAIRKSIKKYGMKTADQLSWAEFMAACTDDVFKISFYRAKPLTHSGQCAGVVPLALREPRTPPPERTSHPQAAARLRPTPTARRRQSAGFRK